MRKKKEKEKEKREKKRKRNRGEKEKKRRKREKKKEREVKKGTGGRKFIIIEPAKIPAFCFGLLSHPQKPLLNCF